VVTGDGEGAGDGGAVAVLERKKGLRVERRQ